MGKIEKNDVNCIFGIKSGFMVSTDDLKHDPVSESRCALCWIGTTGNLEVYDWELGEAILIPHKIYLELCRSEDGETGLELISKYYKENFQNMKIKI